MKTILMLFTIFIVPVVFASASSNSSHKLEVKSDIDLAFEQFWLNFDYNSNATMNALPKKFNHQNKLIKESSVYFSNKQIQNKDFVQIKSSLRSRFIPEMQIMAGFTYRNQPEAFFNRQQDIIKNAREIETAGLQSVRLSENPWSGDYWPTYRAGAAARYASDDFPYSNEWKDYSEYFKKYLPIKYDNEKFLQDLSPSEKYDILVGDENFTLTNLIWEEAQDTARNNEGKIETWFGLCHGWAPAAYMLLRPEKVFDIRIENFQGRTFNLRFYPDDVKALATQLWANTNTPTYFLGGRCDDKEPEKDSNGRLKSDNCFDINPGSWHVSLINQVGGRNQSFVIDATYDYQVWNQPVSSYSLRYFHPQTKKQSDSLESVVIPIEEYTKDKFKNYRNKEAKFIVGVHMKLSYIVESSATHAETDTSENDIINHVQYIYDLELDENYNIIGGEWYQNAHPDFIWNPYENSRAESIGDRRLRNRWDGNSAVPPDYRENAPLSSSYGQPLARVIEMLIQRARSPQ